MILGKLADAGLIPNSFLADFVRQQGLARTVEDMNKLISRTDQFDSEQILLHLADLLEG